MQWNEFVENVQRWAAERGILESSTPFAQTAKTASELSEIYEAVAKGDKEGIKDGIGDVAVTVVILAKMFGVDIDEPTSQSKQVELFTIARAYRTLADIIEDRLTATRHIRLEVMLMKCAILANTNELKFMDCCAHAWDQIKGRRGKMVGGIFVKECDDD